MKSLILTSAVLLQISWCYAYPGPAGVGAYAYQDSSGRRYGGTYDLKDDFNPFSDPFAAPFNDVDAFFPDYFRNFENILQQFPNFGGFPFFGPGPMPFNAGQGGGYNGAFAGAAAGPGFTHQVAAIDPINRNVPNVNVVNRFNDVQDRGPGKFYSVSSSSIASSSNVNGKEAGHREAETIVNDNGKITKYKVHN